MTRQGTEEPNFEWDDGKADLNAKKHGVTFSDAMEVFEDPHRTRKNDERGDYDGESRWYTVGMTRDRSKTLVVVYTLRMEDGVDLVRIISAWSVGDRGRRRYGYRETEAK